MVAKSIFALAVCCGLLVTNGSDDLTGIKCIVNGDNNANKESSAEYRDGEVYFCCDDCKKSFEEDSSEFEVKANHQLVLTGQYTQTGCPFSGEELVEELSSDVGGVAVGFCCPGCKKKVDGGADVAAKASLVFSNAAFEKGFAKSQGEIDLTDIKCFLMTKRDASEEFAVDYRDGKVFFCCIGCPKKYAKDPAKYAAKANQQLVATGQYTQKACPFSGSPVDDEQSSEFNGMEIKFCCGDCKTKFDGAEDDDARAELAFADAAFEKGFEKK